MSVRTAGSCVLFLTLLIAAVAPASAAAEHSISFELLGGTAFNFGTPLSVEQGDHPEIDFTAEYETRPLESPFYYAWRVAFERGPGAWELQFVHHKLYLTNPPDEIQHFEISHGFNILTLNRAVERHGLSLRAGFGLVVAHPQSDVRGMSGPDSGFFDTGYVLTGPAALLGVGKEFPLTTRFSIASEAQLIAAWARVPVGGGRADAPHVGLHWLIGIRYRL